ncbi:MAG: twin-arginine translocation signal domain-containing protein, partial [Methylobacteriaceae bacterium]|nr:twin-arginine translocation signal domain-containing protein [Methylobacteriaceae bacterium]
MRQVSGLLKRFTDRRSFLKSSAMAAGVSAMGAGMFPGNSAAQDLDGERISEGDEAILRFLAAAEIIESDLWQQYNELGGVNGGSQPYINALEQLDGDLPQYITDNTDDEISHETFLNAYLVMKGGRPVDLDGFRTLPSSQAT